MKGKLFSSFAAMLGAMAMLIAAPVQAWEPKKPVEFIIMAGTGGGADQIARLL
jgi:tripartite-type tricarboxylate transporter receptor subunit TctC